MIKYKPTQIKVINITKKQTEIGIVSPKIKPKLLFSSLVVD